MSSLTIVNEFHELGSHKEASFFRISQKSDTGDFCVLMYCDKHSGQISSLINLHTVLIEWRDKN